MSKARAKRSKRPSGVRVNPRIVSRPAVLPPTKDTVTRTLLNGIDALGDVFRRYSDGRSQWKVKKGGASTVWVAHMRQTGDWDWRSINGAAHKIETMKAVYRDISDRRLSFCRLHYRQYDNDGDEVMDGWYAPSPLTTWENLVKALQEESNMDDPGSRARRYENTTIDEIVMSFASRANV